MIHQDIEFHNVVEVEPSTTGGVTLRRFPSEVRQSLCPLGRMVSQDTAGCEIRCVTEAPSLRLAIETQPFFLAPYEMHGQDLLVFRGAFFHSRHIMEPGKVNHIHLMDMGHAEKNAFESLKPEVRATDYFSPNVWRFMLGRYNATFHELDTYGESHRPPQAEEKPRKRMLCYGSSITNGASPTMHHLCYVSQAARHLKVDAFNQGLSGSCQCEKEVADYLAEREDWDIITLELGVNMRGAFTPEEFQQRSRYLIERIIARHPDKPVVLITIYPNGQSIQNALEESEHQVKQLAFDTILRETVKELQHPQLHLVEGSDILTDYSGITKDLIHPGDYGHSEMGLNLAKFIQDKELL